MKNGLSANDFAAKFLAPWNAHDVQAVLAELPDDFEWQFTTGTDPSGAIYRGKAQVKAAVVRLFDGDQLRGKRSYRKVVTQA